MYRFMDHPTWFLMTQLQYHYQMSVDPVEYKLFIRISLLWTLPAVPGLILAGLGNRHFSLLNVNVAGACGYDFRCDGGRLVRAYLRR